MKFRTVILKCKVDEIVHVRERLDEIAAVTEGKIWFETILQHESGTYAIVCHYPDSNLDMFADYIKNKNELHIKISKLEKVIEALTGRPADEIVKNYNICDNGFGVNYRRREKSILGELAELKKENEELKKRLESAEKANYITPLRDRVDICEEKINEIIDKANEHESDLDNAYTDIGIVQDKMKTLEADLDDAKKRYLNDKKDLEERLDTDFDDVYAEFQSTKDQVNDINMGYIKWSSEVSQFDERIEKLEENMKEIAANGGLGLSFNLMNARVSSNKRDISSLRNDIDDIHNWINAHDKILEEQSKQMSDLGSELDEYIDDYKEAYKHLDNSDNALERRIKALEIKAKDFDNWFDGLSGAIDNCGKDIKVVNNTLSTIDSCLDDLNNRLKAIEKRLSIKPFYAPTEDEKDD